MVTQERLASLRDRFSAQIVDLLICLLFFWYIGIWVANHYGGVGITTGGFELHGKPALFAVALFTAAAFIYFFLTEWILGGTPGKLLCGMRVRCADGGRCGLVESLARNFLRPVDAILFYGIGLALIMTSEKKQRLGDRVAGTTVVRVTAVSHVGTGVSGEEMATWEQRTRATIIDLILLFLFSLAYLFATGSIVVSGGLSFQLVGFPFLLLLILYFAYYAFMEGIWGGTIGKMFAGLRVVYPEGESCDFTGSIIRTVLRTVDSLFVYLPAFLMVKFTGKRQRLGDMAAGTVVVKAGAHPARVPATAALLVLTAILGAWPFMSGATGRLVSFSPSASPSQAVSPGAFQISGPQFSKEENGQPLSSPLFNASDPIYFSLALEGAKKDSSQNASLHADAAIRDPSGRFVLKKENVVSYGGKADESTPVTFRFHFSLPAYVPPGNYSLDLLLHDDVAQTAMPVSYPFQVNAPNVPHSSTVAITDLSFSDKENGTSMASPQYAPGQTVWLGFNLVGLQGKDGDNLWLVEHLTVTAPDGKVALDRPDIWDLHQDMDYFPDYMALSNNINLPSDAPVGDWKATISFEDKNRHMTAGKDVTFTVR